MIREKDKMRNSLLHMKQHNNKIATTALTPAENAN